MRRVIFTFISILLLLNTVLYAEVPTRDSVTKLYVATFNRAPDAAGLNYWLNDSGLNLEGITQSFFDQQETKEMYPPLTTNRDFIKSVYQNLFDRDPDDAGWNYWEDELNSGRIGKSVFILAVINGALGDDAVILENKKSVGVLYTESGLNDTQWAKDVMENVNASLQSVDEAAAMIDILVNPVPEGSSVMDVNGTVQLGYIADGRVSLFKLSDLAILIATVQTSASTDIDKAGSFTLENVMINENAYYLLSVTGGDDIDINDDGQVDTSTQVDLNGTIHVLVTGEDLKGGVRITALSDMAYQKIKGDIAVLNNAQIKESLNKSAKEYLFDVDANEIVDYKDILAFDPVQHTSKTKQSYEDILNIYVPKLHSDESQENILAALLSINRPKIVIENGRMQEVPFNLNATLENIPTGVQIKWFLDGVETSLNKKISIDKSYALTAKVYQNDELLSQTSQNFSGVKNTELTSVLAKATEKSVVYITEEDNTSLVGTKIIIPSGALKEDTTITVKKSSIGTIPYTTDHVISEVLVMEPSGLTFETPVIVRLPYIVEPEENSVRIARYSNGGEMEYLTPILIDRVNKEIVFETDHFSVFQAIKYTGSKSPDEELVQFLNNNSGETHSMEEWEPILNTVIESSNDIEVRVYDFAVTLFENYKINGFVTKHKYIAALRVLFPTDDSTGSKAVARWNEVKGALSFIGGLSGFNISNPILSFIGLCGLPNDVSSMLEKLDFPIYNPVTIGGDVIAKLDEGTRNGQINEFWPYLNSPEYIIENDPNTLGRDLMQNLAVLYHRNKGFNLSESLGKLKTMIQKAQEVNQNNSYTVIDNIPSLNIYTDTIASASVSVSVSVYNYGYDSFEPNIAIYHKNSGTKIEADIDIFQSYSDTNIYDLDIAFNGPIVTGIFDYQLVYDFKKEHIVKDFSVEVKNKTIVEFIDYAMKGKFQNGGDYIFYLRPVFKDDRAIEYRTMINIPGVGDFSKYAEVTKEEIENLDLSNVSVTFDPIVSQDRRASKTTFNIDLSSKIADQLSGINSSSNLVFYKWNEKYFETGHDVMVEEYDGALTINKGDTITFWPVNSGNTVVYYDLDGDDGPNSKVDTMVESRFGSDLTFYVYTYNEVGLFSPSILVKDKITGKEILLNSENIRVVDSNSETQNTAPTVLSYQTISVSEGVMTNIILLASDEDGDTLTSEYLQPSHGTLTGTGTRLIYTPNKNYEGEDSFSYVVKDGKGGISNEGTVKISVVYVKTVEHKAISLPIATVPYDTCRSFYETGCEAKDVENGKSYTKTWTFTNTGNVDLTNVRAVLLDADSEAQVDITSEMTSSIATEKTGSISIKITLPEDITPGMHHGRYKLVDSNGDLYYPNGNVAYFWYKFQIKDPVSTKTPQNVKAEQTENGVLLSWDAVAGASAYVPLYALNFIEDSVYADIGSCSFVTDTSCLLDKSDFTTQKTWYFAVRADNGELSEKITFVWHDATTPIDMPEEEEIYDENGRLLTYIRVYEDHYKKGSYNYYSNGNMETSESITYNADGSVSHRGKYTYDEGGIPLTYNNEYNHSDGSHGFSSSIYDSNYNNWLKTESTSYNSDGSYRVESWTYHSNGNMETHESIGYNSDGSVSYRGKNIDDENGAPLAFNNEYIHADGSRTVESSTYSSNGNLLTDEVTGYNADGSVPYRGKYTYDEDGTILTHEYEHNHADGVRYIGSYTYDNSGSKATKEFTDYHSDGSYRDGNQTYHSNGKIATEEYTEYNADGSVSSRSKNTYDDDGTLLTSEYEEFIDEKYVSYPDENDPKDSCQQYSDTGCEKVIERGESFLKEWNITNTANIDLTGLSVEEVSASSDTELEVSISQAFPDSLAVNDVGSYKLQVTVPANAKAGVHKALYKLVDSNGDLYYMNDNVAYFWYKFKIEEPLIVDSPQNVKVEQQENAVLLSWDAVEGASGYTPLYSLNFTENGEYADMTSSCDFTTDTSCLLDQSNFTTEKTWYFAVQADNGELSEKIQFIWDDSIVTKIPINLTAILSTEGIELSWDAVAGAGTYTLMRSVDGILSGDYIETIGITTTNYFFSASHFFDNEILYFSVGVTDGEQSEKVSTIWTNTIPDSNYNNLLTNMEFSNSTLTASFNEDMNASYTTSGDYSPSRSYWSDKRTFVIDFESYTPGGTILLQSEGFISEKGVAMDSDVSYVFPQPTELNYQNSLVSGRIINYGEYSGANYIRITPPEG